MQARADCQKSWQQKETHHKSLELEKVKSYTSMPSEYKRMYFIELDADHIWKSGLNK